MSDTVGMSKRELERTAAWMMREMNTADRELARQTIATMIELIVRNNAAIAASLNTAPPNDDF